MSTKPPGGLFVVSAPSGGGKTSLTRASIDALAKAGITAEISVSYTTRAPRPGEQDGVHYHFIDRATFEAMIARGEFLEHATIYAHYYGTARARTEQRLAAGRDVILDIDWQGARQIRQHMASAIGIYILPPSMTKLAQRLRLRKQDSEDAIRQRLEKAREEMAHYEYYDYLIVNRDFEQAMGELVSIFVARRLTRAVQEFRHKPLIQKLIGR
ncbi:MAG: guanylate kinase [Gammaproteobacteria bacterium]